MGGHWHDSRAASQNVGNHVGDRSCVRQSKLYRQHESGNQMKEMLGQGSLKWDVNKKQGAYAGQPVFDHNKSQVGAPRAAKNGGGVRSPGGKILHKGDYGYGVPNIPKPEATYGNAPWGTDPVYQQQQQQYSPSADEQLRHEHGYYAPPPLPPQQQQQQYQQQQQQYQQYAGGYYDSVAPQQAAYGYPDEQQYAYQQPVPTGGRHVEVVFKDKGKSMMPEIAHEFGSTTAPSLLQTRPW